MYLALLNESEKEIFLEMAYNFTTVDGYCSELEKSIINGYCHELQYKFDENKIIKPMEELVKIVAKNSSDKTKKIIIFELVGLAIADGNYHDDERKTISYMENEFGVSNDFSKKCENILSEYIEFQNKINEIVIG